MTTKEASAHSPVEPSLVSASSTTTPDTASLITPNEFRADSATPQPDKLKQEPEKESEGGKPKSKMPPPPLPINIVQPTPPRMTRLPSLQQISSHLHISSSPTNPATAVMTPATGSNGDATDNGRPSLSLATGVPASASSGQGFASSPSGRLKMPVSAMKRTMSSQGNNPLPTPLSESATTNTFFNTSDPFQSPVPINGSSDTPKTADQAAAVPPPMARSASKDYVAGYKAVPSLAQIKQRHQEKSPSLDQGKENIARSPGAEVETRKPEVNGKDKDSSSTKADESTAKSENVNQPNIIINQADSTPGKTGDVKTGHPLASTWTMYFDSKTYQPPPSDAAKDGKVLLDHWEASLLKVGDIDTVESFCRHFNNIRLPSRLNKGANYHLFKKGIRPMWEDPANAKGGKWVVLVRTAPHLTDFAWANLVMGLVGNTLDPEDEVCGLVASARPKIDRISLWTRSRADADAKSLNALGKRMKECMGLEDGDQNSVSFEFQYHASDAHPPPGMFWKQTFPPDARAYPSNIPSTPSRLGTSHLPDQPDSPGSRNMSGSRSPRSTTLGLPSQGEPMRRIGSGQGMGAFAGPMGSKRNSFSGGPTVKTSANGK